MSGRTLLALACAGAIAGVATGAAGGDPPLANGALTIAAPAVTAPAGPAADSTAPAKPMRVAPAELQPLGVPAAPVVAAPPDDPATLRSTLDRLDPRHSEIGRVLGALGVVLVLIFVTRFMLRRAGGPLGAGRPSGVLEILGRYPVGRGQHLVLLKLARRVLLVHQAGGSMTTLTEVVDPREVATLLGRIESGGGPRSTFAQLLRRTDDEHAAASLPRLSTPAGLEAEVVDLTRDARRVRRLTTGRGVA